MWISDPSNEPWVSTESTLAHAVELAARINAEQQAFLENGAIEVPSLLEVRDGVGIVSIAGPLYTSVPDWAKALFGVVDYPQIRQALVDAAKDSSVGSILLDINSGGGAVNGVMDVANLVRTIDQQVKPVLAYAGGTMASAAYWIPSGAREILAGDISEVGSIGVIARHIEQSKALEKDGLTVTTIRSGPYKQAVNPYEPLSALAKQDLQSKIDYTYGLFLGAVADLRGVPASIADSKFGQGRTFLGQQAVDAGLVDSLASFEEALDKAKKMSAESIDKRKSLIQNPKKQKEGTQMPQGRKAALTAQDIAALASGATLPDVDPAPAAPDVDPAPAAPAADTDPAPAAAAPTADPAPAASSLQSDAAVVALLQAQLREANETLFAARLETSRLTEQVAALQVANEALTPIARDAVSKMCVALGRAGTHAANLSGAELVAEHAKVSADFRAAFPIGGVAATGASDEKPSTDQAVATAEQRARVAATRFVK